VAEEEKLTKVVIDCSNGTAKTVDLTEDEIKKFNAEVAAGPTELERKLKNIRMIRNGLLAETDWMANSDVTMSDAWKKYRQDLRDITKGVTLSKEVVWPTAP
jgi:hypothetical protein